MTYVAAVPVGSDRDSRRTTNDSGSDYKSLASFSALRHGQKERLAGNCHHTPAARQSYLQGLTWGQR